MTLEHLSPEMGMDNYMCCQVNNSSPMLAANSRHQRGDCVQRRWLVRSDLVQYLEVAWH